MAWTAPQTPPGLGASMSWTNVAPHRTLNIRLGSVAEVAEQGVERM
jgi:hypothetical protein